MHEDAYLGYKRYKVEKLCFKGHPWYTSASIHKHTVFVFFKFFLNFFYWKPKKKKKKTNKQSNFLFLKKKKKKLNSLKNKQRNTQEARTKMESLKGVFFLPNRRLGGRWSFPILRHLNKRIWRRIKPIEVFQEHHSL